MVSMSMAGSVTFADSVAVVVVAAAAVAVGATACVFPSAADPVAFRSP